MNRRELFGLGGWCLASGVVARDASRDAAVWRLRVEPRREELAPWVTAQALAVTVQTRGAGIGASVVVENGCAQSLSLRSAGWDRDLTVAAGATGHCRMDVATASLRAVAGDDQMRGWLGGSDPSGMPIDAEHVLPMNHWYSLTGGKYSTLGTRVLTASEPIRVRHGDRVRFRFFNASATRAISLHLPAHAFDVLAFDERHLPRPVRVARLEVAPGEHVDAQVGMNEPGRWILGSLSRVDQQAGFGRCIEYAGARGAPVAPEPAPVRFSYARFAPAADPVGEQAPPSQEIIMGHHDWDRRVLSMEPGRRQRLVFYNLARTAQLVALRGHDLELRQTGAAPLRALYKHSLSLPPSSRIAVDVVPRRAQVELLRL